MKDEHLNTLRD